MSYSYSENVLVQGAAGDLLHDELGWELVYAHNRETLGANGTLGRTDYHQVLLTKYLRPALFRLNSWMTEAYADSVVKSLMETSFSATPHHWRRSRQFPPAKRQHGNAHGTAHRLRQPRQ